MRVRRFTDMVVSRKKRDHGRCLLFFNKEEEVRSLTAAA
jgi:hypothetical protein